MRLVGQQSSNREALPLEAPQAGDVVVEIGLIVALHLALALAVALTLNAFGIA